MPTKPNLQVRAVRPTARGLGTTLVPEGTLGYLQGSRGDRRLVKWVGIKKDYPGDWCVSDHPAEDLQYVQ